MRLRFAAPALLPLIVLGTSLAWGISGTELDRKVREISDQLRCPTCQAVSVNDSEASFSRQIRDKVRRMLLEGQSEEEILGYFVSRYGEWILRAPKKEGLGLLLWVLPGFLLVVVGGMIGFKIYRNSGEGEVRKAPPATSPDQLSRIEGDLRRFEEED